MIESPCIKICQIESTNQLCTGCWRTLEEIARWSQATDIEKQHILSAVRQRRASVGENRCEGNPG